MPPSETDIDPELLRKLEIMLKDPVEGPKLKAMLNDTTGGTGQPLSLLGALGQAGSAASKQQTPSSQLGSGIGTLAGLGLGALFKKKKPDVTMAGRDPNSPGPESSAAAEAGPPPTPEPAMPKDILPYDDNSDNENYRRGGGVKRRKKFAAGGDVAEEAPAPPAKRGILTRRPVLSTTIVIAPKKKPEKKKTGGRIKARKPAAIPPRHGPGNGGPPAPFAKGGRVQVPRGSGCAQRGKQFRGIY